MTRPRIPSERRTGRRRVDGGVGPIARMFPAEALAPLARPGKGAAGRHYGNDVQLPPTGRYWMCVSGQPRPVTGTDTTETLEFDLEFDAATPTA